MSPRQKGECSGDQAFKMARAAVLARRVLRCLQGLSGRNFHSAPDGLNDLRRTEMDYDICMKDISV